MDRDTKRFEAALRFMVRSSQHTGDYPCPEEAKACVEAADALLAELERTRPGLRPNEHVIEAEDRRMAWIHEKELAELRRYKAAMETLEGKDIMEWCGGYEFLRPNRASIKAPTLLELAEAIQRAEGE